ERENALANLYTSRIGEARALRLARGNGYRALAWARLEQALRLDTPGRDPFALRQEAAACLGDFVGLGPIAWDFHDPPFLVSLAVHPRGKLAALGFTDGTISLRSLPDGTETARLRGHASGVFALAFTPQGDLLASGDDKGTVKLWQRRPEGVWTCTRALT